MFKCILFFALSLAVLYPISADVEGLRIFKILGSAGIVTDLEICALRSVLLGEKR